MHVLTISTYWNGWWQANSLHNVANVSDVVRGVRAVLGERQNVDDYLLPVIFIVCDNTNSQFCSQLTAALQQQ